jgi:hypothetical protein
MDTGSESFKASKLAFELREAGLMGWEGRMILPPDIHHAHPEDLWWRAELDIWGRDFELDRHGTVELIPVEVVGVTKRGVWLKDDRGKRFVRGDAVRQYAVPTIELAVRDLHRRLMVRARHLSRELKTVNDSVRALGKTEEWRRYGRTTEDQPGQDPPAVAAAILGFAGDGH